MALRYKFCHCIREWFGLSLEGENEQVDQRVPAKIYCQSDCNGCEEMVRRRFYMIYVQILCFGRGTVIQTLKVAEASRLKWCPSGPGTIYPALKEILATLSGTAIRLWDATTGSCICTMDTVAYRSAFSADGRLLSSAPQTGSDTEIKIWSTRVR